MEEKTVDVKALVPVKSQENINKTIDYLGSFLSVKIETKEQYDNAAQAVGKSKAALKYFDNDKKNITSEWATKKNAVDSFFKENADKIKNGIDKLSKAMSDWYQADKAKREAEQRRLEEEAEEKRKKAEEAALKELEKVEKYRNEGREDMAEKAEARFEAKSEQATSIVAQVVEPLKTKGTSAKEVWVIDKVDKKTAIEYLVSQPDLIDLVTINVTGVEKLQNVSSGKKVFPGITFKKDIRFSSRGF